MLIGILYAGLPDYKPRNNPDHVFSHRFPQQAAHQHTRAFHPITSCIIDTEVGFGRLCAKKGAKPYPFLKIFKRAEILAP
jgi:hypothetical protein